jgi:hypothetical protein
MHISVKVRLLKIAFAEEVRWCETGDFMDRDLISVHKIAGLHQVTGMRLLGQSYSALEELLICLGASYHI